MWKFYHLTGKQQKQYSHWQSSAHWYFKRHKHPTNTTAYLSLWMASTFYWQVRIQSLWKKAAFIGIYFQSEIRNLIQSYTSEQQRNRPSKGSNVSKKQKWGQEVDIKGKYSLEDHKSKFHTEALRSQQQPADIVCRSPEEAEQTQTVQMWELRTFLVNVRTSRWNMHALHSTLDNCQCEDENEHF